MRPCQSNQLQAGSPFTAHIAARWRFFCAAAHTAFHRLTEKLGVQGLANHWRATQDWVTASGAIDIDFLATHFGQAQVWVSDTTRYPRLSLHAFVYLCLPVPRQLYFCSMRRRAWPLDNCAAISPAGAVPSFLLLLACIQVGLTVLSVDRLGCGLQVTHLGSLS